MGSVLQPSGESALSAKKNGSGDAVTYPDTKDVANHDAQVIADPPRFTTAMRIQTSISRRDATFTASALAIFVIGMATGRPIVMLVTSLAALMLMMDFYRKQFVAGPLLPAAVALAVAIDTVIAIYLLLSIR
jgi:hypothetical protein